MTSGGNRNPANPEAGGWMDRMRRRRFTPTASLTLSYRFHCLHHLPSPFGLSPHAATRAVTYASPMPDVVALDLRAGQGFVDALRRTWDAGDAVLPVDPRLPRAAVQRLLDALRPSAVIDKFGSHPRSGGLPSVEGDALVVATSGTTGAPKGVVLTHQAVEASAMASSRRIN